ncbi:hypothetical protein J2I47_20350 [Fibrella sp. HMF5335]|uniref:Uncharacterized protein n=1 Tax=Fibrella rubiginis TaxID=2817060 RepID=A0A939GK57_9BACT|nr:hypothetical protein [Fibrella rubiginis]MBO0938915.1 hypothetical protein [Fibrella rubiginis]
MNDKKKTGPTPEEQQANIDHMIMAWKNRKKELEQHSQTQFSSPEYQAALAELDKRRIARGSRTVKV